MVLKHFQFFLTLRQDSDFRILRDCIEYFSGEWSVVMNLLNKMQVVFPFFLLLQESNTSQVESFLLMIIKFVKKITSINWIDAKKLHIRQFSVLVILGPCLHNNGKHISRRRVWQTICYWVSDSLTCWATNSVLQSPPKKQQCIF